MERCTVDQFPHPVPASPCGSRREIFTDYGSLGAVCVSRGATVAQKSHGSHVQPRLCASRPALPLLQPHHGKTQSQCLKRHGPLMAFYFYCKIMLYDINYAYYGVKTVKICFHVPLRG